MQASMNERKEYQEKYGLMKDYIQSMNEDKKKKKPVSQDNFEFNNKQLVSYLEDKSQEKLNDKTSNQQKEYIILRSCFMIQSGFNVCIHGYGSKKPILTEISDLYTEVPKIIVQGYSPASQIQQFLQKLKYIVSKVTGVSSGSKRSEGIVEYLHQVKEQMDKISATVPFILIVFHNIDAKQFVEQDQIRLLSKVFSLPYIRAVCSVDHTKYSIALTPKVIERFNFTFFEYHSHDCYMSEFIIGQNTFTIKKEKEGEALKFILRSLTKVQKEIIQFLAKYIKDKLDENPGSVIQQNGLTESGKILGVTLKELLEMLLDEMILNNEQQLKENLLEILDHKVFVSLEIQQKTYYTMTYSRVILDKIINNKLEEEEEEEEAGDQDEEEDNNQMKDERKQFSSDNSQSQSEDEKPKKRRTRQQKKKSSSQSSRSNSESESQSEEEKPKQPKRRGRPPSKKKDEQIKKKSYVSETEEEEEDDNDE